MKESEISYQAFKKTKPSWTKKGRRNLEYYALLAGIGLGKRLSLQNLQKLGRGVGKMAYHLLKKDRGIVAQQLALAFPDISEQQRQQWTRECFLHFGQMLFEILGIEQVYSQSEEWFNVSGEEFLREGKERGKGTIILVTHLGNWEFLVPYFAQTGYPAKIAVASIDDKRLNEFIVNLRQKGNMEVIQRGQPKASRAILECFKQNEIFFVLIDQDTEVSSIFVPFFGIAAQTPVVASNLAMKTGALVLSATAFRQPSGKFDVQIERVGTFEKKKIEKQDVFAVTAQFNRHIEQIIRRAPPQWVWFHRRWKHRPTQEDLDFLKQMSD